MVRLQVDCGEPFRFVVGVEGAMRIGELVRVVESDFAELYGRQFQARLQVLRLQDSHHNDMPPRLLVRHLLRDLDTIYVVIKNLALPTLQTDSDQSPKNTVDWKPPSLLTDGKITLPSPGICPPKSDFMPKKRRGSVSTKEEEEPARSPKRTCVETEENGGERIVGLLPAFQAVFKNGNIAPPAPNPPPFPLLNSSPTKT